MRRGIWIALAVLSACGARLDLPPDAGPCIDGDAHLVDGGACFMFFAAPAIRDDARTACAAIGAHLAYIRNNGQNVAVDAIISADAFLGASDEAMEGTFLWGDGSPVTYTNWNPGEPNNGGNNGYVENCVVMEANKDGLWDDRPCASAGLPAGVGAYAYVCER